MDLWKYCLLLFGATYEQIISQMFIEVIIMDLIFVSWSYYLLQEAFRNQCCEIVLQS
jgi:hypothetical protein